jgi:polyphosphate kinase 2 (PPK2 family)
VRRPDSDASDGKKKINCENVIDGWRIYRIRCTAHNRYGVLDLFTGMDTSQGQFDSGRFFKDLNPEVLLCTVLNTYSKEPEHDILYEPLFSIARKRRKFLPFNRTHYENVLVTRVHPEYILNSNLPKLEDVSLITDAFGEKRMEQIRNFEEESYYRKWNH